MGIGTFVPSDPKSQDISELVGSIDLSTVGDYGSESDPRAYRFDGELNVANRGLMEFIEMLKADERFLYVLLTLSQEKNIKTGRFPLIYADECVISHTNETEFNEFLGNKKSEALHDRMIMVRIPYNLKVSQEERIYQKLLRATSLEGVHMAPHTLRVAAIFAVLSRLEEPKMSGLTLLKKLKLYDGEDVDGFRQKDVKQIKEQTEREGMDGISPRFIINRISTSLIKPDTRCINPIDVLRALKDGIEQQSQFKKADRERYANLLVAAHVFGHVDFFKNNLCFADTNRRMVNDAVAHALRIDAYIERYGLEVVEHLMDIGFALDRHTDPHKGLLRQPYPPRRVVEKEHVVLPYDDLMDTPTRSITYAVEGERLPPTLSATSYGF